MRKCHTLYLSAFALPSMREVIIVAQAVYRTRDPLIGAAERGRQEPGLFCLPGPGMPGPVLLCARVSSTNWSVSQASNVLSWPFTSIRVSNWPSASTNGADAHPPPHPVIGERDMLLHMRLFFQRLPSTHLFVTVVTLVSHKIWPLSLSFEAILRFRLRAGQGG